MQALPLEPPAQPAATTAPQVPLLRAWLKPAVPIARWALIKTSLGKRIASLLSQDSSRTRVVKPHSSCVPPDVGPTSREPWHATRVKSARVRAHKGKANATSVQRVSSRIRMVSPNARSAPRATIAQYPVRFCASPVPWASTMACSSSPNVWDARKVPTKMRKARCRANLADLVNSTPSELRCPAIRAPLAHSSTGSTRQFALRVLRARSRTCLVARAVCPARPARISRPLASRCATCVRAVDSTISPRECRNARLVLQAHSSVMRARSSVTHVVRVRACICV